MQPTLQIADETGLLLALWPDGTVQVPQDAEERARVDRGHFRPTLFCKSTHSALALLPIVS